MARAAVRRTRLAERDVRAILLGTFRMFGPRQLVLYARRIDQAVDILADEPLHVLSRDRPEVGPDVRSFHLSAIGSEPKRRASHVLFYTSARNEQRPGLEVVILRVLHERMMAQSRVGRALREEIKRS